MDYGNQTLVMEFVFVGLANHFQYQVVLFVIFLFVYLVTLLGNLGIVTLIRMDSRLHIPMYFFLSHLSFVDVCSSSFIGPKMFTDIFLEEKSHLFLWLCCSVIFFLNQFVVTECFLLSSMAFDQYMAICKPLLYALIMSQRVCVQLVVGPYAMGLISAVIHTVFSFCLPYCGSNIINHFFCDLLPVFSLACADTQVNKFLLFIVAGAGGVLTSVIILVSCSYIIMAILRIRSAYGRWKVFSTCSSHLAVSILCGTLFFTYVWPSSSFSLDITKVVSVFYTAVIPMLNPLISSLRNKEVKNSFRRACQRNKFLMGK